MANQAHFEVTEKHFTKWLTEMEQSLSFIEKRLTAESELASGHRRSSSVMNGISDSLGQNGSTLDDGEEEPLYSNVSEMQQMHLNYYEKIKVCYVFEVVLVVHAFFHSL